VGADRAVGQQRLWGCDMSVYKVVEIIGTSSESWEEAAMAAVTKARETIRQVRVAEVVEQDLDLTDDAGGATFRTKLRLSFKYEDER
jgi:dodecin